MASFVIDASTALAWVLNEGGRGPRLSPLLRGSDLVAPWLWRLEVVQAITRRERQKRATVAQGTRMLRSLESLGVEFCGEPEGRSLVGLAGLSRPHQLSSYDALYLELAVGRGLPLLTGDRNLRDAARRVGVELVEPAG